MDIKLLQRLLGSSITITLNTGEKYSGSLTEIVENQIILGENDSLLDAEAIISVQKLDNQIETPDSSDSTPNHTESVESLVPNSEETDAADFERASEKLAEIKKRFNTEIQTAKIELKPPNLLFPVEELPGWQDTGVYGRWIQFKNQYEYAQKIGELSPKFNRIQKIVHNAKSLTELFPASPTLKQVLAYFYSISDDWNEARQNYQRSVIQSRETDAWFNVAVCALKLNKEELACYSLEKFFHGGSIRDELSAWYVYVNLLERFNNFPAFKELCDSDTCCIAEEGIKVLLETALYLLMKKDEEAVATAILQRRGTDVSEKSLLHEACLRLDENPTKPYQDFLTAFIEEMRSREKKPVAKTLKPREHTPIKKKRGITKIKGEPQPKVASNETTKKKELYYTAKRAADSGAPDRAKELFKEVIEKGIRVETANKDLANIYIRLGEANEAVRILADKKNRDNAENKPSWDRVLISAYQHAGAYKDMIPLLQQAIKLTHEPEKQAQLRWQIADAHMELDDYEAATEQFREVSKQSPENTTARIRIVICLAKQKKYSSARKVLNELQTTSPDAESDVNRLITAIAEAETTGEFNLDDKIARGINTELSYFAGRLDEFARFFLDGCRLAQVVPTGRVNDKGSYVGSEEDSKADIKSVIKIANEHKTKRPLARSDYYLLAARILFDMGDYGVSLYQYLCRSFASRGDAAIHTHLEVARTWYCEALTAYDQALNIRADLYENDAAISIVRYLYSTLLPVCKACF